ncbi:MAG: glycogen/starch synthase [Muribaculaceae bacterium]|nr:glycogen/starch synthase [Muribaculaceae bacterium]
MAKERLLLVTHKIFPYLPVEEPTLGKMFPQRLAAKGYEVRTFMPKFGVVNERRNQLHEVIRLSGVNISINNNDHPLVIKVASLQPSRIQVYFVDNDDYFTKSKDDVDELGSNRPDNDERAIYFAHGTADTVKKLLWDPSIVHVSGWISALLPLYLKKLYARESTYLTSKVVYSVLPGEITGRLAKDFLLKLRDEGFDEEVIAQYEKLPLNTDLLHFMAIDNADAVIFHLPFPPRNLLERAKARGIPILFHENLDEDANAISDFFKQLTDAK